MSLIRLERIFIVCKLTLNDFDHHITKKKGFKSYKIVDYEEFSHEFFNFGVDNLPLTRLRWKPSLSEGKFAQRYL